MAETLQRMGPPPSETSTLNTGFEDPNAADFAAWEGPATGVHPTEASLSPTAELIRGAASRLANMLENRAIGKNERQENHAERVNDAKDFMKRLGYNTLSTAIEVGVTTASISYLTLGSGVDKVTKGVQFVQQKFMQIKINAETRRKERAANKYTRDHMDAIDMNRIADQQVEAYAMDEQITKDRQDAQNEAYDSYAGNIDVTQKRESQEAAYASYEDNIEFSEFLDRRMAALERKANRKARNKVRLEKMGARGREVRGKVGRFAKRLGKAAVRVARKSGRALAAGARAAANSWQQAA